MTHCDRCPMAPGEPCCGHLCDRAGSPEWDAHIRGRNAHPCPGTGPPPPPPSEVVALLAEVRACPHREKLPGCCAGSYCHRDRRGTSDLECIACVKGTA